MSYALGSNFTDLVSFSISVKIVEGGVMGLFGGSSFKIERSIPELNAYGYRGEKIGDARGKEHWLFRKSVDLAGKLEQVNINVEVHKTNDEITFAVPLYGEGDHGFLGDRVGDLDSLLIALNSRMKYGGIVKDINHPSCAVVFLYRVFWSGMTSDTFRDLIRYCFDVFLANRPILDRAKDRWLLSLDPAAGDHDPGRKALEEMCPNLPNISSLPRLS
ncbi:MAG: hypothetical protein Fur0042_11580 [Cyanophyceae cyanobacterium]